MALVSGCNILRDGKHDWNLEFMSSDLHINTVLLVFIFCCSNNNATNNGGTDMRKISDPMLTRGRGILEAKNFLVLLLRRRMKKNSSNRVKLENFAFCAKFGHEELNLRQLNEVCIESP